MQPPAAEATAAVELPHLFFVGKFTSDPSNKPSLVNPGEGAR